MLEGLAGERKGEVEGGLVEWLEGGVGWGGGVLAGGRGGGLAGDGLEGGGRGRFVWRGGCLGRAGVGG